MVFCNHADHTRWRINNCDLGNNDTNRQDPINAGTCSLYGGWVTDFTPNTYQNLDQHAPLLSGSFSCQSTSWTYSFTASQIMAFAANVNANDALGFGLQLNGLRVPDSTGVTMDDFSLSITTTTPIAGARRAHAGYCLRLAVRHDLRGYGHVHGGHGRQTSR